MSRSGAEAPEPSARAQWAGPEGERSPLFIERKRCPVCDGGRLTTLYSGRYDQAEIRRHIDSHYRNQGSVDHSLLRGVDFTILECRDCSLIFQKMVPTPVMMHRLYDTFIDPERLKVNERSRLTVDNHLDVTARLSSLLIRIGKEPKDTTLLDFGFGYGRWARVAVGMGMTVFATEISPEKIAFAESIGVRILDEADLKHMRFDIVHTEQVFEHLTNPAEAFALLANCVAPGGVLKFATPRQGRIRQLIAEHGFIDWSPYERGFRCGKYNAYNTMLPLEHLNAFNRKSVEALARRHGMTIEVGSYGGSDIILDLSNRRRLLTSARHTAWRLLKDVFVRLGPGRADSGCYVLARSAGAAAGATTERAALARRGGARSALRRYRFAA